jgi:hypothetical protein
MVKEVQMITDEQAERVYQAMVEVWGDKLPNPIHEPRRIEYYLKMFRYCHGDKLIKALEG